MEEEALKVGGDSDTGPLDTATCDRRQDEENHHGQKNPSTG